MLYCDQCSPDEPMPVAESELPILVPEQIDITQTNGSPLGRVAEFVNTTCPKCGGPARRETHTKGKFVGSGWAFYRDTGATDSKAPFRSYNPKQWVPFHPDIRWVGHCRFQF